MNLADMNEKTRRLVEQALADQERFKTANRGVVSSPLPTAPGLTKPDKPRIRQRTKPLLNGLETRFLNFMRPQLQHGEVILAQAVTLKIANGSRLTPDFAIINQRKDHGIGVAMWEVKGPYAFEDSLIKLKVAASLYPFFSWTLASYKHGTWIFQPILP